LSPLQQPLTGKDNRPILDYGGWGVRFGTRGQALSVGGNRGVELALAGGERRMVGSRRADELERAISRALSGIV
jgi:hypothetical protein